MRTAFIHYLREISGGATQTEIARVAGVAQSNVSRWVSGQGTPSAEAVVRIAAHYAVPVPEALWKAGLITRETAHRLQLAAPTSLETLPHATLLREIERRLDGMSDPGGTLTPGDKEDPHPDEYDLAAGHIDRPDDIHAD